MFEISFGVRECGCVVNVVFYVAYFDMFFFCNYNTMINQKSYPTLSK
jgi:hypothetical protein